MSDAPSPPILAMRGVTKLYPGVTALSGVDFSLAAGEIHGLVGENGAGKSTFIKILSGDIRPDAGAVLLDGASHAGLTPRQALDWGVRTVYQDDQLVDELSCAENIFLGVHPAGGFHRRKALLRAAAELAARYGIDLSMAATAGSLAIPRRKLLAILKALAVKPRVVLLDEPSVALDEEGKRRLGAVIEAARRDGVGMVYISHHLNEVFAACDRLTVLKDGRVAERRERDAFSRDDVVRDMIGRDTGSFFRRRRPGGAGGEVLLSVKGLASGREVEEASFEVRAGEILGIGGMSGSGRSELLEAVFGLRRISAGAIHLCGERLAAHSPNQSLRRGLAFLTEDRKRTGLVMGRPIYENEVLSKNALARETLWRDRREIAAAVDISTRLAVATPSVRQLAGNLSGGNQQKVVLAKWLLTSARVVLFDEPTVGVDVGAKREIYDLVAGLAEGGRAVVVVSSDIPELIALSDRVGIMRNGRLVRILGDGEIDETAILAHSIGAI